MSSSSEPSPSIWSSCHRSIASLRARQLTGTHLLRIDGYSAADRLVLAGDCVMSRAFTAGSRRWQLSYYPNGHDRFHRGGAAPASVKLELKDASSGGEDSATAAYRLSILDGDGNPALSCAVGPQRFDQASGYSHRVDVLAAPEERRAALRLAEDDDSLSVRCDVSVTKFEKEWPGSSAIFGSYC